MLFFKNDEKGTYFLVDPVHNKVVHLRNPEINTLQKFAHIIDGEPLTTMHLPNLKTVQAFRKIVEKGTFHNLPSSKIKSTIEDDYPELFI